MCTGLEGTALRGAGTKDWTGAFGGGLGAGAQVGGAFLSAVGAYNGSQQAQAAYRAQAQIQEMNAATAETQARDALVRGDKQAYLALVKSNQHLGTQRAGMAANGVDIGTGSALQVQNDTSYYGQLDADTIRDNAAREAWGYRQTAITGTLNADLYRARANAESPLTAAGTSLLTSAGKVSSKWYGGRPNA